MSIPIWLVILLICIVGAVITRLAIPFEPGGGFFPFAELANGLVSLLIFGGWLIACLVAEVIYFAWWK